MTAAAQALNTFHSRKSRSLRCYCCKGDNCELFPVHIYLSFSNICPIEKSYSNSKVFFCYETEVKSLSEHFWNKNTIKKNAFYAKMSVRQNHRLNTSSFLLLVVRYIIVSKRMPYHSVRKTYNSILKWQYQKRDIEKVLVLKWKPVV